MLALINAADHAGRQGLSEALRTTLRDTAELTNNVTLDEGENILTLEGSAVDVTLSGSASGGFAAAGAAGITG